MLKESLALLAATKPPSPIAAKRQALADLNAEIAGLQTELGLPHTMPVWNAARATALVEKLRAQTAANNATPPPTAAQTPGAPAATRPVEPSGDGTLDRAIVASGTHNLRTYKLKARRDRLFAAAVNLPPGSIARACAESNLQKAEAALRNS